MPCMFRVDESTSVTDEAGTSVIIKDRKGNSSILSWVEFLDADKLIKIDGAYELKQMMLCNKTGECEFNAVSSWRAFQAGDTLDQFCDKMRYNITRNGIQERTHAGRYIVDESIMSDFDVTLLDNKFKSLDIYSNSADAVINGVIRLPNVTECGMVHLVKGFNYKFPEHRVKIKTLFAQLDRLDGGCDKDYFDVNEIILRGNNDGSNVVTHPVVINFPVRDITSYLSYRELHYMDEVHINCSSIKTMKPDVMGRIVTNKVVLNNVFTDVDRFYQDLSLMTVKDLILANNIMTNELISAFGKRMRELIALIDDRELLLRMSERLFMPEYLIDLTDIAVDDLKQYPVTEMMGRKYAVIDGLEYCRNNQSLYKVNEDTLKAISQNLQNGML